MMNMNLEMELYVSMLSMVAAAVWLVSISGNFVGSCRERQVVDQTYYTWDDDDLVVRNSTGKFGGGGGGGGEFRGYGGGGRKPVIVVSQSGGGDSRTVQGAVNKVPVNNNQRVKIIIRPGLYREKVTVPSTKPFISFIGSGSSRTVISWNLKASDLDQNGQPVGTYNSATVAIESDYFGATNITFLNTAPRAIPGREGMQAVALRLSGDKTMIKNCRILGSQDTLYDHQGRHYFFNCYIQGSIDFIFGIARSLYHRCILRVTGNIGSIAASQRSSMYDNSGFSFLGCIVYGSGRYYLGRTWGMYARVVYSLCKFDGHVNPQGWTTMADPSFIRTAWFGEFKCTGLGANRAGREPWSRSLSYRDAKPFASIRYIDGDQWLKFITF